MCIFLAHFSVFLQEYGINKVEKIDIAYAYCLPLVRKIQLDLQRTHEDESVNKLHPLWVHFKLDGKTWCEVFGLAVVTQHWCLVGRYSRGVMSPGRHVRTRLYFTSESHVHSLLSIFRYGGLLDVSNPTPVIQAFLNVFQMRMKVEPEFLFVFVTGGEGPAVEACHGLPQCCLWTQLYDSDCHHAVWGQQ